MTDDYFEDINTTKQAFLLGCFVSSAKYEESEYKITLKFQTAEFTTIIRNMFFKNAKANYLYTYDDPDDIVNTHPVYSFEITSPKMYQDLFDQNIYDQLSSEDLKMAFIKGYYESSGFVNSEKKDGSKVCGIKFLDILNPTHLTNYITIPYIIRDDLLIFQDTNAIDFLGIIYGRFPELNNLNEELKYEKWKSWICKYTSVYNEIPECYIYKADPSAIIPSKSKESDVGYDLSVIKEKTKLSDMVSLYDTGIQVEIKHGLYIEVVPRSSLSKSGYMLANSIGIIDANYRGNILVALIKINPDAPDIQYPFRCCQIIFRKQIYANMIEVSDSASTTGRGAGGFGSTGI
jgi:deoxyuridine 5'-triphosphate nucleotidohydrolase